MFHKIRWPKFRNYQLCSPYSDWDAFFYVASAIVLFSALSVTIWFFDRSPEEDPKYEAATQIAHQKVIYKNCLKAFRGKTHNVDVELHYAAETKSYLEVRKICSTYSALWLPSTEP